VLCERCQSREALPGTFSIPTCKVTHLCQECARDAQIALYEWAKAHIGLDPDGSHRSFFERWADSSVRRSIAIHDLVESDPSLLQQPERLLVLLGDRGLAANSDEGTSDTPDTISD
jgi:hypothetical protein